MATTATTHGNQETAFTPTLFLAFALGVHTWKLGCTPGAAQRPRERQIPASDGHAVLEEIRQAKSRCGLPEEARVVRCDAAGRDGVWLQRFFARQGVEHAVGDSARIAVHRRYRRAQTDRLAVHTLLTRRLRHAAGAKNVWSVVRVPRVVDADRRQLPRARLSTQRDRPRVRNRSKGLLAGSGSRMAWQGEVETPRDAVRQGDGTPLPAAVRARLKREWQQVPGLTEQSGSLEAERRAEWRPREEPVREQVRQWATRRGMGGKSAWRFVRACFAGRDVQTPQPGGA